MEAQGRVRSFTTLETKLDENGTQITDLRKLFILGFLVVMVMIMTIFALTIASFYITETPSNNGRTVTTLSGKPLLQGSETTQIDYSDDPTSMVVPVIKSHDTFVAKLPDMMVEMTVMGRLRTVQDDGITVDDYYFNNDQSMRVYGGYLLNMLVLNVDGEYVRYTFPNPLLSEEERMKKGNSRAARYSYIDYLIYGPQLGTLYTYSDSYLDQFSPFDQYYAAEY